MTTALTPALALDYVRELSADIVAGVVLDARGERLAGDERLAEASRALPDAALIHGETEHGQVFAARDDTHSIVVVTGPFALARVTRHDLLTALSALGGRNAAERRRNDPFGGRHTRPPERRSRAFSASQSRLMVRFCPPNLRKLRVFSRRRANPVRTRC